jgi:hypothetical protein
MRQPRSPPYEGGERYNSDVAADVAHAAERESLARLYDVPPALKESR